MPSHRTIWIYARFAVTLVALGALVMAVDWPLFISMLRRLSVGTLVTGAVLGLAMHVLLGVRWHVISGRHLTGSLWLHVGVFWRASVFSLLTPASVGADAYRIIALRGGSVGGATIAGLVIRERFVGLTGYLACYLAALALAPGVPQFFPDLAPMVGVGLLAVVGGWITLCAAGGLLRRRSHRRIAQLLERTSVALRAGTTRELVVVFLLTLGACGTWFGMIHVFAIELGARSGFAVSAMTAVLAELVRILPLSVQGIGLRESVFGYAFQASGDAFEIGVATGALAYLIYNLVVGFGGLAVAVAGRRGLA